MIGWCVRGIVGEFLWMVGLCVNMGGDSCIGFFEWGIGLLVILS